MSDRETTEQEKLRLERARRRSREKLEADEFVSIVSSLSNGRRRRITPQLLTTINFTLILLAVVSASLYPLVAELESLTDRGTRLYITILMTIWVLMTLGIICLFMIESWRNGTKAIELFDIADSAKHVELRIEDARFRQAKQSLSEE